MSTKSPRTRALRDETAQDTEQTQQEKTEESRESADEGNEAPRTATLTLPFVTAEFRAPQLHMPQVHLPRVRMPSPPIGRHEVAAAAQVARSYLPPPRQAVYYGGLTLLAALEVIEWPVAAAMAVGAALLSGGRESGEQVRTEQSEQPDQEDAESTSQQ